IEKGNLVMVGDKIKVINRYLSSVSTDSCGEFDLTDPKLRKNSFENSIFKWKKMKIVNSKKEITSSIGLMEPFEMIITGELRESVDDLVVGFGVMSALGVPLFNSYATDDSLPTCYSKGEVSFRIRFDPNLLGPGYYTIDLAANGKGICDWIPFAAQIYIEQVRKEDGMHIRANYTGIIIPPCKWEVACTSHVTSQT
ncbi:MAG: Wzt carbohydrate-binding domain-containing protein, partial [Thermoplasmata archaeon]